MRLLGIDYGQKKLGVAVAFSPIAEPYSVIRRSNRESVLEKIKTLVEAEQIERVVVGISEGEMAKETKNFADNLRAYLTVPVDLHDETLSTQSAQKLAQEANVARAKRKRLEDAYAASIMLQSYLDGNV